MSDSAITKETLQVFVRVLCARQAEDVEKVVLHVLDTSRNRWNRKASEYLRQLKDKELDKESMAELKKQYKHAFDQAQRLSNMRYGVAKTKRPLGGDAKKAVR